MGGGEGFISISLTLTTIHYREEPKFRYPTEVGVGEKKKTKEQWCLWVSSSGHWAGVHGKSGAQQPWEEEGSMAGQGANGSCGI